MLIITVYCQDTSESAPVRQLLRTNLATSFFFSTSASDIQQCLYSNTVMVEAGHDMPLEPLLNG